MDRVQKPSNPEEHKSLPLKLSWQRPLVLLVNVVWRKGKELGSMKKVKRMEVVLYNEQRK
jgi:hypothetical protein